MGSKSIAVPGYDATKSVDLEASRAGRTCQVTIPRTPRNDAAVAFAHDVLATPKFNMLPRRARLTEQGSVLLEGVVRLLEASDEGYTLEIRDGGARWARNAARRMFNTLEIEYQESLNATTILRSWADASPVKFFPIIRDEYPQQNSSQDLLSAERILSVDDYHPFLHLATLLEQIFTDSGYRIASNFLTGDYFRSLYMSGAYSSRDTTAAQARMGFFARRLASRTSTADHVGRVYADPYTTSSSVGNFVDTATPQTLDADGEPIPELHNNGGCFVMDGLRISFKPLAEVSVSFEFYIKYTTDHRILSRTRLKGFDSVNLSMGGNMPFTLANRYVDRRGEVTRNRTYLLLIFNFTAGAQFRIGHTTTSSTVTQWATTTTRATRVTSPTLLPVTATPVLQILTNGSWAAYTGDWALYDGYITETGTTTVELRLRTPGEILTPLSAKYFSTIFFSGADTGMTLTLDKACSVRPIFVSSPGYGEWINFADVAQHRIRQLELLEGVAHLFNLRFYTEEATKRVFIEPEAEFMGAGVAGDWHAKSDFAQPVTRADVAQEVAESRVWCYREGDGAVRRFNASEESPLGEWTHYTDSYAPKQDEKQLMNPLFQPTISTTGRYSNAPSAWIMQVGDRDELEGDGTNFAPRIVRYVGMKPLPSGERWGYPSDGTSYPFAAFHFAGDAATSGFTLCFEDRDAVTGLHRFYDHQAAQESYCERITLSLHLAPHEFESLLTPETGMPDLRSEFWLDIGEERIWATLHKLGSYDPQKGSVRCTFTRRLES